MDSQLTGGWSNILPRRQLRCAQWLLGHTRRGEHDAQYAGITGFREGARRGKFNTWLSKAIELVKIREFPLT